MKPVLMVDGEVVAQGEEYMESTLGTKSSFTIHITSGGKSTSVTNEVTTGSMYAVTLDSQSITAPELQGIYDEVSALKDSVTEENVYSEDYLGKLLNLAGKLYFAQVDIADTIASDLYDVAVTRSLSEGITGYEVETTGLYGMVTGISEGSLYIDVDTDSHSVISLEEDSDVAREYFLSTGMVSSLYESTVWEEITGQESVSTISILAKASEENIDILLLSKANLLTEIEKLNTDETTKQSIMNAVNSGMMVTVPAEEVTMGDWSGTGYIVTNPKTGVGEYMISGGLNGGITKYILGLEELVITICSAVALAVIITTLAGILSGLALVGCAALILVAWFVINYMMWTYYMEYFFEGDLEAGEISETEMEILIVYTVLLQSVVILPLLGENRQPDTEIDITDNNPESFLKKALSNQGLETAPNELKETWIEGEYKYTVRIHKGNGEYTNAKTIYRVSRQSTILNENGQGTGVEYLGTDGNWYHKSVLTEFYSDGTPNPKFDEHAARITHIELE